jgi:hypothetical protein
MGKKKEEKIDLNNIKPEEAAKYEIASELGYLDKVMESGWKSLTAKESGRIGGIMTKRKRELQQKKETEEAEAKSDSEKIL